MSAKYYFEKVKENVYQLSLNTSESKLIETFEGEKKVATALCAEYFRAYDPNCEVVDDDYPAIVTFKNGQPYLFNAFISDYDNDVERDWTGKEANDDGYTPECSRCGDGGCIHCRPSWFI